MTKVQLYRTELRYRAGIGLYTAASRSVSFLEELYIEVSRADEIVGIGGIRVNVEYLTGIKPDDIEWQVTTWISNADWSSSFSALLDSLHLDSEICAPARALIDQTLHDAIARQQDVPVHRLWTEDTPEAVSTNQTLFWCDDCEMVNLAKTYVDRGFTSLKLRMGIGSFEQDIHRLRIIREVFGNTVDLSADVNGAWNAASVDEHLTELLPLNLSYVEQPLDRVCWDEYERLAGESPITIMLDESASSLSDICRIASIGGKLAVHLKLIKLGGFRPLLQSGKRLLEANVPIMIGQMNEGAMSTAAAIQAAVVLKSEHNELYGADGIINDPVKGLVYSAGKVSVPASSGIGLELDSDSLEAHWSYEQSTSIPHTFNFQQGVTR